jgi:hypothetical protein
VATPGETQITTAQGSFAILPRADQFLPPELKRGDRGCALQIGASTGRRGNEEEEEGVIMKKLGFATIVTGGIVGAFLGLGAPAQAVASPAGANAVSTAVQFSTGNTHRYWLDNYGPNAGPVVPDGQPHPSH